VNVAFHYSIEQVATITNGQWLQKQANIQAVNYLSLDSRKVVFPEETMFFAIRNRHNDANRFIQLLYQKGVRNFVTDDKFLSTAQLPEANILVVKNVTDALQHIGAFHRKTVGKNLTVIGITGSNGKTVVKEWLNELLENDFSIVRSPKSFNSQVGVPLSVLAITESNTLGIFEAGISFPGEMEKLEKIIQPTIGLLTNIGNAHDEGFESRHQKIREKLILFKNAGYLIYPGDDSDVVREVNRFGKAHPQIKLVSWGNVAGALMVENIKKGKSHTTIQAMSGEKKYAVKIPFTDDASIENAISCLAGLVVLNKTGKAVLKRFQTLYPLAMRLELRQGINNCTLINDSYSNDLDSLSIALAFQHQQKQHQVRSVILSDILQSGKKPHTLYAAVAKLLKENNIDRVYAIGPEISAHRQEFQFLKDTYFFESTTAFLDHVSSKQFHDETVLIKGARSFQFEKISQFLEQKVHQTVLTINLNALVYNLKKYKEKLLPGTKIMAMVKAFSYGSGSYEIASVLEYNKVDYLAVAYADEGVELRRSGITLPVMVMNTDSSTFDAIINYNLEPEIFSFGLFHEFNAWLKEAGIEKYPVHLKIDTGMHRLGFMEEEVPLLCQLLAENTRMKVKSVFSHLAASESKKEDAFTRQQFAIFKNCCSQISKVLPYSFDQHIDNTSGISRHPEMQLSMVRLGIGLYGLDGNKAMQKQLKNVSTLTTTISQIKRLKAGETVGYGRAGKVSKDATIAVVRIGYADGYSRALGNGRGKMLVADRLVPVVGNVCMDMTMLDISGVKGVSEGDEVVVFGESLPLNDVATAAETIAYEIMTGISQRVKRVYYEE
jgi:Alr-MurF fusion protein